MTSITETHIVHSVSSTIWDGGPWREYCVTLPLTKCELGIDYQGLHPVLNPTGAIRLVDGVRFERTITFVLEPGIDVNDVIEALKPYLTERYEQSFAGPITMEFRRVCAACGS